MKYKTIVADPPWHYDEFCQIHTKAGRTTKPLPYKSMSIEEICSLKVPDITEKDCRLFLWTTNKYLPYSFKVMESWKFEYKQIIIWQKTGNPSPWGGSVAPNHAEFLLVGVHGKPKRLHFLKSNIIPAKVGKRHSAKPQVFMDYVEMISEPPYLELFSRRQRLGWDVWGDEVESNIVI